MSAEFGNPYEVTQTEGPQMVPEAPVAAVSPPRIWTVVVAFLVGIAASFAAQIAVIVGLAAHLVLSGAHPERIQTELTTLLTSPGVFTLLIVTGPGPLGVVALIAAWISPWPLTERLGLVPVRCSRSIYPLSMLGSILPLAVGLALAHALVWLAPWLPADDSAERLYDQMTLAWAVPFVALIGLIPGFCEEMLFRGYMQRRITARFGPVVGILVASVLFGMAHVMPHVVIFATLLGFYFGLIAHRAGSIWPPIACHLFVNSGLNAWRMVVKFGELPDGTVFVAHIVFVALGTVCFLLSLWILYSHPAPGVECAKISEAAPHAQEGQREG